MAETRFKDSRDWRSGTWSQQPSPHAFKWLGEWTSKGAKVLDAPQEYPQYAEGYYAVYFTDPCGMKLEVAHILHSVHEA
jgi:hypothetical protein